MAIPNGANNSMNNSINSHMPNFTYNSSSPSLGSYTGGGTPFFQNNTSGFNMPGTPSLTPNSNFNLFGNLTNPGGGGGNTGAPQQSPENMSIGSPGPFQTYFGSPNQTQQQPVSNPNSGIVSSGPARRDIYTSGARLDQMTSQVDPYLEYLQKRMMNLQNNPSGPSAEEKNASVEAGRQKTALEEKFNKYKAGLESLGIQSGLSRYAPGLQADKLINADKAEAEALQTIQEKEDFAIAKAKQARLDNDAKTLKETVDEIRQIKKDKADELQRQLNKRTQDITVANSIATQAYKQLQSMPADQKEEYLNALADQNNIDVGTLVAALAKEQDDQYKFRLTTSLQQQQLNNGSGGSGGKVLSTAALNYIKKQNPMLDLSYGMTQQDVDFLTQLGSATQQAIQSDLSNPDNVDDDGYLTAEYVKSALGALPPGFSKLGFLESIKPSLYLNKYKYAKEYGITQDEFNSLTGK